MKKLLLYFFCLTQIYCLGQNFKGKIIYSKTLNFENLSSKINKDSSSISNKATTLLKELETLSEDNEYQLLFNNLESNYSYIKKIRNESDKNILSNLNLAKFKGNFYFDSKNGATIHNYNFAGELFRVTDSIKNSYELTKETKKIGNYICYKAILKKSYTKINGEEVNKTIVCWYTIDIPVPFGPEKYNSLPGLILQVITDKENIIAKKIEIYTSNDIDISIEKPKRGKKITYQELNKYARKELKKRMNSSKLIKQ